MKISCLTSSHKTSLAGKWAPKPQRRMDTPMKVNGLGSSMKSMKFRMIMLIRKTMTVTI